jgi:hypothetical protein
VEFAFLAESFQIWQTLQFWPNLCENLQKSVKMTEISGRSRGSLEIVISVENPKNMRFRYKIRKASKIPLKNAILNLWQRVD